MRTFIGYLASPIGEVVVSSDYMNVAVLNSSATGNQDALNMYLTTNRFDQWDYVRFVDSSNIPIFRRGIPILVTRSVTMKVYPTTTGRSNAQEHLIIAWISTTTNYVAYVYIRFIFNANSNSTPDYVKVGFVANSVGILYDQSTNWNGLSADFHNYKLGFYVAESDSNNYKIRPFLSLDNIEYDWTTSCPVVTLAKTNYHALKLDFMSHRHDNDNQYMMVTAFE